jgi:hypothetical protein
MMTVTERPALRRAPINCDRRTVQVSSLERMLLELEEQFWQAANDPEFMRSISPTMG